MNAASTFAHLFFFGSTTIGSAVLATEMVDDGWAKLIAGGGAATLVAGLMVWVLRHTTASTERTTAVFATSTKESIDKFAETTTTLLREQRLEAAQREDKLIGVLKDRQP